MIFILVYIHTSSNQSPRFVPFNIPSWLHSATLHEGEAKYETVVLADLTIYVAGPSSHFFFGGVLSVLADSTLAHLSASNSPSPSLSDPARMGI